MFIIIFEKIRIHDLPDILRLSKKLLIFEKKLDNTIDIDWDYLSYLTERINNKNCYAKKIILNDEVIGYFISLIKQEEEYRLIKQTLELEELYIIEEYQNKGIGSQVIEKLRHIAGLLNIPISVKVSTKNKNAIEFYNKMGFNEYDLIMETS